MVTTEEQTQMQQGWVCAGLQACGPRLTAQEILLRGQTVGKALDDQRKLKAEGFRAPGITLN